MADAYLLTIICPLTHIERRVKSQSPTTQSSHNNSKSTLLNLFQDRDGDACDACGGRGGDNGDEVDDRYADDDNDDNDDNINNDNKGDNGDNGDNKRDSINANKHSTVEGANNKGEAVEIGYESVKVNMRDLLFKVRGCTDSAYLSLTTYCVA